MKRYSRSIFLFVVILLAACSTSTSVVPTAGSNKNDNTVQIAVVVPIVHGNLDITAEDVMIGINRIAQEFGGTIYGRKETVDFGEKLEFKRRVF